MRFEVPGGVPDNDAAAHETPTGAAKTAPASDEETTAQRRPGRRRGAPGYSRTQRLNIDAECTHAPTCCRGCGEPLSPAAPTRAHYARYEIDLIQPGAGSTGLVLRQTKHTYLACRCACGHWTQAEPGRADVANQLRRILASAGFASLCASCREWKTFWMLNDLLR